MTQAGRVFRNRKDAGMQLATKLKNKYKDIHPVVLGIPMGGILVAEQVAQHLGGKLSAVITKTLSHPDDIDQIIGAVAEDGSTYLHDWLQSEPLPEKVIEKIVASEHDEINSRINTIRRGEPLPGITGNTVIIVDDGIAAVHDIIPVIKLCRNLEAAKVIVATPVTTNRYVKQIMRYADDVIVGFNPEMFYAVGQAYDDFHRVTTDEVLSVLHQNTDSIPA